VRVTAKLTETNWTFTAGERTVTFDWATGEAKGGR
jgi:hypothetical protein